MKELTQIEFDKLRRESKKNNVRLFCIFCSKLTGMNITLNGKVIPYWSVFNSGLRNADDIINRKTKYKTIKNEMPSCDDRI